MRLVVLLLLATATARADTPILDGRLVVDLPPDLVLDGDRTSERWSAELARGSIKRGTTELVVVAMDTLATAGDDLAKSVQADLPGQGIAHATLEKLPLGIGVVPARATGPRLIYAAYLAAPGTTVRILAFYVLPAGDVDDTAFVALAKRVAVSAAFREVASRPHVMLPGVLRLPVVDGWRVVPRVAEPLRWRLTRPAPLGWPAAWCDISVRTDPPSEHDGTTEPGTLLGERVTWTLWRTGATCHAATSLGFGGKDRVEVSCEAPDRATLDAHRAMVERMQP